MISSTLVVTSTPPDILSRTSTHNTNYRGIHKLTDIVQSKWGSENCCIIIFHLSQVWDQAKFFILFDAIFLVRLQAKFEILITLGSERVKGSEGNPDAPERQEQGQRAAGKKISVLFSQPGESPILSQTGGGDKNFSQKGRFCLTNNSGGEEKKSPRSHTRKTK